MNNPYAGRLCFFVSDAKENRLWESHSRLSGVPAASLRRVALSCAGKCEAGAACVRSWRTEPSKCLRSGSGVRSGISRGERSFSSGFRILARQLQFPAKRRTISLFGSQTLFGQKGAVL